MATMSYSGAGGSAGSRPKKVTVRKPPTIGTPTRATQSTTPTTGTVISRPPIVPTTGMVIGPGGTVTPGPPVTVRQPQPVRTDLGIGPQPVRPPAPAPGGVPPAVPGGTTEPSLLDELYGPGGPDYSGPLGEFRRLQDEALEAALGSIEAQYGLTREQLLADQSALGQEYQFLNAQLEQNRARALEQTEQSFQERGILASGLAAEGVAETEQVFADEAATLARERSTGNEQIQSELERIQMEQELAELEARRQREQALLDIEIMQMLSDAGV